MAHTQHASPLMHVLPSHLQPRLQPSASSCATGGKGIAVVPDPRLFPAVDVPLSTLVACDVPGAWGSMWGPLSAVALWVGAAAGGAPDGRAAAPATPFMVPFSLPLPVPLVPQHVAFLPTPAPVTPPHASPMAPTRGPAPAVISGPTLLPPQQVGGDLGEKDLLCKMKLHEWFHRVGHPEGPAYSTVQSGPRHLPTFTTTVLLPTSFPAADTPVIAVGCARTKREAEHRCAAHALQQLQALQLLDAAPPRAGAAASPLAEELEEGRAPTPDDWADDGAPSATSRPMTFQELKEEVHRHVTQHPGKRHTVYLQMCPAGVTRKQVQAALFALLKDGRLENTTPTNSRNLFPFWHPPGYAGPLGGNCEEPLLGTGRERESTGEVTRRLISLVLAEEGRPLTAKEVLALCAAKGEPQPLKVINAALYAMKRDGHAYRSLTEAEAGKVARWELLTTATPLPGREWEVDPTLEDSGDSWSSHGLQ